jgi:hypothetical protein
MIGFSMFELIVLVVIFAPLVLWFVTLFEIMRSERFREGKKSDYSFNLFLW